MTSARSPSGRRATAGRLDRWLRASRDRPTTEIAIVSCNTIGAHGTKDAVPQLPKAAPNTHRLGPKFGT